MEIGYTCAMPRGDIPILFSTRIIRLFAYGFLSVVLVFYLIEVGLDERVVGLLFTFTLAGDAGISLWLTTSATRRRSTATPTGTFPRSTPPDLIYI